ncbi:hypothetical protein, partial [Pseudoalteromonas ruthenica]|uniref:hypothetical protein n=1 Tax=Pseudoalteromonas ruthenica TaxID=151081 RepID=UPI001BB1ACCC
MFPSFSDVNTQLDWAEIVHIGFALSYLAQSQLLNASCQCSENGAQGNLASKFTSCALKIINS